MIDATTIVPIVTGLGGALIGAWAGIRKGGAEAEVTLGEGWAKLVTDLNKEMDRREKSCEQRIAALEKEGTERNKRIAEFEVWRIEAQREIDECRRRTGDRSRGPSEKRP